ncbi:MAG: sulfatase, partial [bacterium]
MTRAGKAVSLLTVSLLVGCTSPPPADNVLFVSFDTSRADHFTAYGYRAQTTPTVTALAQRGVLFERAYSHVPSTLPSHSSMFTGLLPPSHGVRCNGKYRLADERLTLAEILAADGFDTAAVIGAFPLAARFGLAQGFDHYDDDFSSSALTARYRHGVADSSGSWIGHDFADFERGGDEVTDRALGWLGDRDERWFLFVHYFDAHWPYAAPVEYAGRFSSPYDAELAFADNELSRLLAAVQKMPGRTLVVFTSDHGEGLGDHGEALHNRYLYDSTQHVPLVMALEGALPAGAVVAQAVGHV